MNRILDRRIVASNQVFNVNYFSVADDNGNTVPNYLVVEPKFSQPGNLSGIAILPIFNGRIALIEMFRPALDRICLEIPHGFLMSNETIEEASLRELREETGLIGCDESLFDLGLIAPDSGIIKGVVRLFLAGETKLEVEQELEFGLGKVHFFYPSEIETLIREEKLIDSFTLVAFYRAIAGGYLK
jgi:ADP-ribose pyrophosphatase